MQDRRRTRWSRQRFESPQDGRYRLGYSGQTHKPRCLQSYGPGRASRGSLPVRPANSEMPGKLGLRRDMIKLHQPVRLIKGQRLQEHGIHHAEDCRVRSDAQREHQHGHRREAGILAEHAPAVSNILARIRHRGFPFQSRTQTATPQFMRMRQDLCSRFRAT